MRRNLPPLNALKAFEAAGRHEQISAAADELAVTHGAVSRQVRQLEEILGVALFEGPRNQQRLTAAGRRLLPVLTSALDLVESGVRSVSQTARGELVVSCFGTLMMRWLIPRLYRFKARYPDIDLRLQASDVPVDFARENLDLAIRSVKQPHARSDEVIPFLPEHAGPVLSAKLMAERPVRTPSDLAAFTFLHTQTRRHAWAEWFDLEGVDAVTPASESEFEHLYFMIEAAMSGLGVGMGLWSLVADDIAAERLVAPFGFKANSRAYVALRPRRRNPSADVFVEWLVEEGAKTPPPPG
ncbi:LysR family transcriptional regulator [Kaustia mangrovi]|uniref:LysR family transcriptional regulator n=1 Tax=Kaustia mangrovi TaxID=2593653 RepID=A0A7S8C5N7_9HYPH|nr:LysR substrate-binding domain-containing protein [Kaustia mangrovi]QPC43865.1 LysR family transcriptional regulator [Kaustia mangrovi]